MNEQTRAICDMAVLLYHVMQMEKQGVITTAHAKKISHLLRERILK